MADQLLSQSDVDALVSSLGRNEPLKTAPPVKPASPNKPVPAVAPNSLSSSGAGSKGLAVPVTRTSPANAVSGAPPKPAQPARTEPKKPEISSEVVNNLNAKIADLTKQLGKMEAALNQLDLLEQKVGGLEIKIANHREHPAVEQRVQQLAGALKKISNNLKDTPGYGVRQSFSCEKCSDHGHVAVMYRCTKCGHERWYGWWPDK